MSVNITAEKQGLKKLYDNKFFTYVMQPASARGSIVEVEFKVIGKQIQYVYRKIKDRK